MITVYRYPVQNMITKHRIPRLKQNGEYVDIKDQILKVDMIKDIPSVWCLVDEEEQSEEVTFYTVGTGWPMIDHALDDYCAKRYCGSYIVEDCEIYHVFVK